MNAVIYARFSCSKQREASIEDQLRVCRDYAQYNDMDVVAEYCDRAVSGRTDDRPEFQRMVTNAGESDVVLVYAMDRFSRDPYDAPIYKRELKKHGVRLVSATENIPDTPEGMLMDKMLEGIAAMESAHNSIRTKRGMEGNAMKCQWNGVVVFGYDVDNITKHYIVNETEAAFVREAYQRRINGESPCSIARDFSLRGVKTTAHKPCSANMVEKMLVNEKYIGVYQWGDIRIEDGMPAIIDKETFERAQSAPRAKKRKNETYRTYHLAGKSVCMCGHNLVGKSANGNGGNYAYYQCGGRCGQTKPIRADWLEDAIVSAVREILSDDNECARIASKVKEYAYGTDGQAKREMALKSKSEAQRTLDNLMDMMKRGIVHPTLQQEIDSAVAQIDRAQRDLIILDSEPQFNVDSFIEFLRFGAHVDDTLVLDAFIGQVVLMPDCVAVTLNYQDENNKPAYMEIDGFAEMDLGSPRFKLGEPYPLVNNGILLIVIPRAA